MWHSVLSKRAMRNLVMSVTASAAGIGAAAIFSSTVAYAATASGTTSTSSTTSTTTSTTSTSTTDTSSTSSTSTLTATQQAEQDLQNQLSQVYSALEWTNGVQAVQTAANQLKGATQDQWASIIYGDSNGYKDLSTQQQGVVSAFQSLIPTIYEGLSQGTVTQTDFQNIKSAVQVLNPNATGADISKLFGDFKTDLEVNAVEALQSTSSSDISVTDLVTESLVQATGNNPVFAGTLSANGLSVADLPNVKQRLEATLPSVKDAQQSIVLAVATTKLSGPTVPSLQPGEISSNPLTLTAYLSGLPAITIPETDISWQSSNPSVATINADDTVTAVGPGTTTITAVVHGLAVQQFQLSVVGPLDHFSVNYDPNSGTVSITALDANNNVVQTSGTLYVKYDATEGQDELQDNDSDGWAAGTLLTTAPDGTNIPIPANSGLVAIPFSYGQAELNYTPSSETGTPDFDWTDTLSFYQNSDGSGVSGSLVNSGNELTLDPNGPPGPIIAGSDNIQLKITPHDKNGNLITGLGQSDFKVTSDKVSTPLAVNNVWFDSSRNCYVVSVSDDVAGDQTLSVSVDGTALKNTLPIHVQEAVTSYGLTYDQTTGKLTIQALDKFGNVMTNQTKAYLNLNSSEGSGAPGDGDGDGFVPGQISGSQVSDSGNMYTVGLTNGTATVSYTPGHELSAGDGDVSDVLNVYQSTWNQGMPQGAFYYGPNQPPSGLATLASSSDVIPSGNGNVKLNVYVHDGLNNPMTGLTAQDFSVMVQDDYSAQPATVDSVSPGTADGEYTITLTDTTAGEHQLQAFLQPPVNPDGTPGAKGGPIGSPLFASGTADVVGTVTDSNGNPITQGNVFIIPVGTSGGQGYDAQIDPSTGTFSLNLPKGNYAVESINNDSSSGSSVQLASPYTFSVTDTPVTLQLQQPAMGEISGSIDVSGASGSLAMYPATTSGQPDMTNPPIYLQIQNGQIQQQSLPVGTYYITSGYLSTLSGYASPYTVDETVTITADKTETANLTVQPLSIGDPSTTVAGNQDYHQVTLSQPLSTTNPVYMTAQVTLNGTPVTTGVTLQTVGSNGQPVPFTVSNNGLFVADEANPIPVTQNTPLFLITQFQGPGNYEITYSLVDSQTNKPVVSGTKSIQVEVPNVNGTAYAADGKTPVPYETLFLQGSTGTMDVVQADQNGHFNAFLPAGKWLVTAVQGPGEMQQETLSSTQQTSFNITYGVTQQLNVSDPFMNLVGVAYEDGGHTKALANGAVAIVPQGADQSQAMWIPTDSQGRFAYALQPGQAYTVIQEANQDVYNQLNSDFTVSSTSPYMSLVVSPNPPDFQYQVKDSTGALVTTGYVGIMTKADYTSNTYQNASWFPIAADGTVSGYLGTGDYVAFAVSGQTSYFPIDVPFTLTDTTKVDTSETLAPQSGILSGTVKDSNGNPIANAAVVLTQVGDTSQQPIVFMTDGNGNFTSMGWNQQGQYMDLVQSGQQYQLEGIGTQDGNWIPGSQTNQSQSFTVSAGENLSIQALGSDLTGTVSVDGTQIQSGWVAFGPANQIDRTGQDWIWARISDTNSSNGSTGSSGSSNAGSYSVYMPNGTYAVYAIENDATGQYYDETGRQIDTPQVKEGTLTSFPIAVTNNFTGQVIGDGGKPIANATLILGNVPNPTTQQDWNSVQYVTTDGQGNFGADVSGSTIYIVGIIEPDGTYAQLGQEESVGTGEPITVDVAANVSGELDWGTAPTHVAQAWIVLQDASNPNQYYNAQLQNTSSSKWTFTFKLPAGTYNVVGVDLQQGSNGNTTDNWIDLTSTNQTVTVPQSGEATPVLTVDSQNGTISGLPATDQGPGYVIFQNAQDNTQKLSVQFSSTGTFTTTLNSADWQAIGVETAQHYYSVNPDGQYGNSGWTLTILKQLQ